MTLHCASASTNGVVILAPRGATLAVRTANSLRQSALEINTAASSTWLFHEKGGGGGSVDGADVGVRTQIFVSLLVCI